MRASTLAYVARLVRLAQAIGADLVTGPAYGSVGLARALPGAERRAEWDRGVPGRGQVAWAAVATALRGVGYRGDVVIESFTPAVTSIAGAVSLWRPVAPDQDTIAHEGLAFLRGLLG